MTLERTIRQLNNRIGAELGFVNGYLPRYKWAFSEDREMQHPMRVMNGNEPMRDFKANENGILEAVPLFALRKMCPTAVNQWVLAEWLASPSEDEWRRLFGYLLEWPRNGQYYPTNVILDPGVTPNIALTDTVIECVREERKKNPVEEAKEAALRKDKREAETKQKLFEEIRDLCTTYDHVPGRRDQISYPTVQTHADTHD